MDVFEAIRNRRSIRRYQDKPISEEVLRQLIDSARWAPSANNSQPWQFVITTDRAKRQAIANSVTYASFLPQASAAIVVCARFTRRRRQPPFLPAIEYFAVQDTAAAIQNILLAAHALGLGTCWIGDMREELLQELFEIPDEWVPVGVLAVGYPAESPAPKGRLPVDDIIHLERF